MSAGRKREFDKDKVLEAAMCVFWESGYGNTKLADLTEAMGINKPSLYNAFGNKEDLFIATIEYYEETIILPTFEILTRKSDSPRKRLSDFMYQSLYNYSQLHSNYGCMLVNSVSEIRSLEIPEKAKEIVTTMTSTNRALLDDFFEAGIANGSINGTSPKIQSIYLLAMLSGFAVMIRGGSFENKDELIATTLDTICKI